MKLRRWAAPLVLAALLPLAGCGQLTPGTAATVDGTRITVQQVDDLADAQCTAVEGAVQQGATTALPISRVKQQSLGLLMDTTLSLEYGESQGITPDPVIADGFYSQFESSIAALPEKVGDTLGEVFRDWSRGRAVLVQAGAEKTGKTPDASNAEELVNAGLVAREAWRKSVEIHTDARYAPAKNGFPGGGDGSVSRATSTFAKGSTKEQPDPAFVGALPAGQKCG